MFVVHGLNYTYIKKWGGEILIVKLVSESNHAKITSSEEIPFFCNIVK